jgi:hypothetical protein
MNSILQHKKFAEAVQKSYAEHPDWWLEDGRSEPSDFLKFFLEWSLENELELLEFKLANMKNKLREKNYKSRTSKASSTSKPVSSTIS